jgi:zinc transporter ZupT
MDYKKITFFASLALIAPTQALAQCAWYDATGSGACNFANFVDWAIGNLFRPVIPVLVSLTAAFFLWGVAQYVFNAADPGKRTEGRDKMVWGIIGLAVIMSFWAIARMIKGTLFP